MGEKLRRNMPQRVSLSWRRDFRVWLWVWWGPIAVATVAVEAVDLSRISSFGFVFVV